MYFKQRIGKLGEDIACKYLQKNGYELIERNFYCRQGEIDIIAKDLKKRELVFFEVKTRTNLKFGDPAEAVNSNKQKHIIHSTKYYLYKHRIHNVPIRLDVIEINIENGKYRLHHIKQAFE